MRTTALVVAAAAVAFTAGWFLRSCPHPEPAKSAGSAAPAGPASLVPPALDTANLPRGRWNPGRDQPAGTEPSRADLDEIADLPYRRGSQPAREVECVTDYDVAAAANGFNLILSAHAPCAVLSDMRGNVLHEWHVEVDAVWPDRRDFDNDHRQFFRRALLLPDGGLLVVFEYIGLVRLDRDSKVVWTYEGGCHHDVCRGPDGRIYTLAAVEHDEPAPRWRGAPAFLESKCLEDFVVVLSDDGVVQKKISVLDALIDSDHAAKLLLRTPTGDLLHTNTVQLLDGSHQDLHPAFKAGNVLLCARNINTVMVLDPSAGKIVWALQGLWSFPHEPTLLDNGHVLIFDNLGNDFQSQVLEVDPIAQKVVWRYRGTPKRPFSSLTCGSVQRLRGGNTLIVETNAGRAFEVTPDHRIVWEYNNPHRAGEHHELVASLMDCVRLTPEQVEAAFPDLAKAYRDRGELDAGGVQKLLRSQSGR